MVLLPSILLPLYIYPQLGAWNWVTTAVTAYPSLNFDIIINPHSGPGPINTFPETNYIDAIATLNAFENTRLLGYVDTAYMSRDIETIVQEVETYNYWATYTPKDIHMSGIFFDDSVSLWDNKSSAYMSSIARYAHTDGFTVTLNPGRIADAAFFNIADNILMVEEGYDAEKSLLKVAAVPITERANSSVIFYHFSGTANEQTALVKNILAAGLGSLYLTTVDYVSESALWMEFVAAVNASRVV